MRSPIDRLRARIDAGTLFASPRHRRQFLVHLALVTLAVAALSLLLRPHLSLFLDADELRAFVAQYGPLAPLVFVLLQALQVVVAPIPAQILAVVGGYLFGPWWGTLYNVLGVTIGSTVAFGLARRFGRAYVERIVHEDALERFDAVGDEYARSTLFVLFFLPGFPDDAICFLGGLTRVPLWQLVAIAVVGRTPGFFLANAFGDLLGTGRFLSAGVLAAVLLALSAVGVLYHDRILDAIRSEG
ncbi:TVP38/TMEM64 family protein [Halobellus rufus]|uniref:TVP38/TMEM64 family protein n=1 Tax=Halobellus rufus TaxID=1448860 RepID=UPI0006791AB8|nr:TVP38/TMEM64 family protein [Halobellus rufus]